MFVVLTIRLNVYDVCVCDAVDDVTYVRLLRTVPHLFKAAATGHCAAEKRLSGRVARESPPSSGATCSASGAASPTSAYQVTAFVCCAVDVLSFAHAVCNCPPNLLTTVIGGMHGSVELDMI